MEKHESDGKDTYLHTYCESNTEDIHYRTCCCCFRRGVERTMVGTRMMPLVDCTME